MGIRREVAAPGARAGMRSMARLSGFRLTAKTSVTVSASLVNSLSINSLSQGAENG